MKILVVRHGQTIWNALGKLQGQTDIKLNDTGREQARQTGNLIKNEKIDLIITSPLKRAFETANIINSNFNVPILQDKRLMERYWGKSEGLTKAQIKEMKKDNPLVDDVWNYCKNVEFNNMENMQDFCTRIYEFLDEIMEKYKNKNILLVTHGGVSVPIKCYCMNYPLEKIIDREEIKGLKNCEVYSYVGNNTNYYMLPGGKVKQLESSQEAITRELKEELGYENLSFSFLGISEEIVKSESIHQITIRRTKIGDR